MKHPDEQTLVDLALGEPVDAEVAAHAEACPQCGSELSTLREVLATVGAPPPVLVPAPASVWDAVTAEIEREDEQTPSYRSGSPGRVPDDPAGRLTASGRPVDLADRREQRRRRSLPLGWVAGAAAAGLVIGGVGTRLLTREEPAAAAVTVASTTLDTLDTQQVRGSADVVRHAGRTDLAVRTDPLDAPTGGYLEVWLINEDLQRMVSVGVLRPGAADQTFAIPQELLDQGYVIVDISREGFDASPEHSGDSLVRGTLAT